MGARLPLLTAVLLLAGCTLHQPVARPRAPLDLPERYAQAVGDEPVVDDEALPDRWWVAFGDPELIALVDEAMARNFELGAAWARVAQAEAVVEGASSQHWPQISAQLDVSRRRQVAVFGQLGRQEFEVSSLGISAPVSYELDLWNRVGAQVAAAGLDVLASRDDVEALAITVAANVVETYLELVQQRALRRVLEVQRESNQTYLELVTLRFTHGLASALDVYQQRQQLAETEAQLATIEGSEAVARQQLAVLVGRSPAAFAQQIGALPEPTALPALPPLPPTGVPSQLLLRRPDVRAARRRVEAADWRLAAAIADQFPSFRFSASIGVSSPSIEDLLGSFVWSLAGNLLAPVLDGGRRAAEVRRQRAIVQERLQDFARTLLTAVLEVERALAEERQTLVRLENLGTQLEAARETLQESRRRYAEGLSDYLPVLTALQSVQRLEQSTLSSQRQLLSNRVQLARALGGTWTVELEPPALPLPADEDTATDQDNNLD